MSAERRAPGHPVRTSGRALVVEAGCVLLVEYRDADGPWYLLPGGGQELDEPLVDCVVREVREELAIEVEVGALVHVREFISSANPHSRLGPGFHQVELIFEARRIEGEPRMTEASDATQTGFAWLPVTDLARHRVHPRVLAGILGGTPSPVYLGAAH